jgi:PAS domain S-box-containing protein
MLGGIRSTSGRLGVAALVVAVALLLRLLLWPLLGVEYPYITFFPVILLAGYWGGRPAGLMATLLGGLVAVCFVIGVPFREETFSTTEAGSLIVFLIGGVLMSLLAGSLYSARQDSQTRAEQLRHLSSQLEAQLASAPVGFAVFDKTRRAVRVNPILAALHGRDAEELVGQPLLALLPAAAANAELVERVFQLGQPLIGQEWTGPLPSGEQRSWLVSLYPIGDSALMGLVVFDISQRRRQEDELRLRAGELAETANRKDIFLAMLSHELRNPLATLRSAIDLLHLGQPARPEVVTLFRRQIGMLTRLVDDLLDSARVSRGQIELRRHTVGLPEVIEAAVETTRPLLESRNHFLETILPSRTLLVKADPVRLTQALANLLHNAARYTPRGGHIVIRALPEANEVVIRIQDTGIGIRPEMLGRIFELFAQADQPADQPTEGLGLGLTLVRRLVELHGGSVMAQSPGPGQGSTFEVRLPLLPMTTAPSPHPPSACCEPPPADGRRVLIVDDNDDAAESLSLLLAVQGNEVKVVHDGLAALEAVGDWKPHVVILDIGLPGMDGYEVALELRRQHQRETPRLIALTGFGHEEDRKKGVEAGFDEFLVKPAGPEDLARAMQES